MKKVLTIAALILFAQISIAQGVERLTGNFSSDLVYAVRGKASSKYENIKKGTPYFIDEWLPATVILFDGKQYDNVMAKIDLLEHNFIYQANGMEYAAEPRIREVFLKDSVNGKKYHFIHDAAFPNPVQKGDNGWYLELANGNVSAYKYITKNIEEFRQYNSAITNRSIENREKYFITSKNVLVQVKRLRDIPDLLRDRQTELNDYISEQKMSRVSDESIGKLVTYYNSLNKQ